MKIVVVGAGIAGSMTALFLAKHYDVTLIQDKKWDKPCGGGTRIDIFDKFNLGADNSMLLITHDDNMVEYMKQYANNKTKITVYDFKDKKLQERKQ